MAPDNPSAQDAQIGPQPRFLFELKWDGGVMQFQEASGLALDFLPLDHWQGYGPQFSGLKLPGYKQHIDVTLKKSVVKNDRKFWDWFNEINRNTVIKKTMAISLLDETGSPTMVWTLTNARPIRVGDTDLKSQGNEVAVEMIVLSHEGLTVAKV